MIEVADTVKPTNIQCCTLNYNCKTFYRVGPHFYQKKKIRLVSYFVVLLVRDGEESGRLDDHHNDTQNNDTMRSSKKMALGII
jgi:hypothetical protein